MSSATRAMQSMRNCLSVVKMKKKGSGGQLAPPMTPTKCRRLSDRKVTTEKVGGQLAPTTGFSWFGRLSTKKSTGSQSTLASSTKLGRPQRDPHPDPYYGHERTAKMSARFIHDLFKCSPSLCPNGIPDDTYPTLDKFIAYALSRSESDLDVHYYAMYLIWRMHIHDPELRAHDSHETYLAALMLATKLVVPQNYASESWVEVGQSIYTIERLLDNEQKMCGMVKGQVEVDPMLVEMIEEQIEMKYDESPEYMASPSSESSEESDESSVMSLDTPGTTPFPSDSDSPSSNYQKPVGECVWW